MLVPDGVFDLSGDGPARFVPLPSPREGELLFLLLKILRRTEKALGESMAGDDPEPDALASLQATEVDRRMRFPAPCPCPRVQGPSGLPPKSPPWPSS